MILKRLYCILCLFAGCVLSAFSQEEYGHTDIADLVLIYQGGVHRPMEWIKDQFVPYVVHKDQKGNVNWLFDGFLFLEFKDGKGRNYVPGYDAKNARRVEWEWLMDRQFEKDKAFSALDQCIADQKKILGKPGFRHQLVVGIPSPILGQKDWGEIDGQVMDFSNAEDRVKAAQWYIDLFLERYQQQNYKNIDLSGFYWVDEAVNKDEDLLRAIGDYIRTKNLKLYWIPYWNAKGSDKWKEYNFDFAWIQPNHFFNKKVPDERLDDACAFARKMNMGVEMEFDRRAMAGNEADMSSRLESYISAFERNGVFRESPIAYYEGGDGFYKFYKSDDPRDQALIDKLAGYIIQRKQKSFLRKISKP